MMCGVEYINKKVFVAYSLLSELSVSDNSIRNWSKRNIGLRVHINNRIYINYDSIPTPTRKKLPSKEEFIAMYKAEQSDEITEKFFRRMEYAYLKGFVKYRDIYTKLVRFDEVNKYAQKHAVWVVILELHKQDRKPKLRNIWEAYHRFYPDHYAYNRMNPAIKKAKTEGIPSLLVFDRNKGVRQLNPLIDKWILDALSSGKAYSYPYIHKLVCELCEQYGYEKPSLSWVKLKGLELLPLVHEQRYGKDKTVSTQLPYKGIERAEKPNEQWQIDGWRLPFYMEGFKTLTLFNVMDAHSGRILGYHIDYSENTETILKGLENAVNNTQSLPFEMLADNHTFNKTKEGKNFKETVEKIGTIWTVSENPRYKSLIERSFKTFGNSYCKSQYGYIGEGIKTKDINGRTAQELMDKYQKSGMWLTEEQIKLIGIKCVEEYNNKVGKDGQSPLMRYDSGDKSHCYKIDKLDCLRLFTREAKYTIRRGQINIERSGVLFEFQLNRDQYLLLNNKEVRVRYFDFEEINLFDTETDEYIGSVPRKKLSHGAKADQTEDDTEQYYKHSGFLKGIKTSLKQRQIEIARVAVSVDPEAAYAMNAKLTPKNIIEEFKENGKRREEAERLGVNLDTVTNIPVFSEVHTANPEPEEKVARCLKSPFMPKNHVMTKITDTDYEDN